jgi:hypothetical protein
VPAILLVDQHGVCRRGIRALIESAELAKVVDRASLQNEFSSIFDLLLIDSIALIGNHAVSWN